MPQRLLILTRDGVLTSDRLATGKGNILLPGAIEAVSRLTHAGYQVIVQATCGLDESFTLAKQNALHAEMQRKANEAGGSFDAFFFCPHKSSASCRCGPPDTGLLRNIAERWRVSLCDVCVISTDIAGLEATTKAGATAILVNVALDTDELEIPPGLSGYPSLAAFAEAHLSESPA